MHRGLTTFFIFYINIFYKRTGKFSLLYTNEIIKNNRAKFIKFRLERAHCMYMDMPLHIFEVVRMLLIYNVMIRKPHTCIINAATYFP